MIENNCFKLSAFEVFCFVSCDKNDVPLAFYLRQNCTERRPYHSAGAVAFNCVADLFTGSNSDTTNARTALCYVSYQCRTCIDLAATVCAAEVRIPIQSNDS